VNGSNCQCETRESSARPGCVGLVRNYVVPISLAAGQVRFDIQQIVDSDAPWLWRGLMAGADAPTTTLVRLEANDFYLSNARVPLAWYVAVGAGWGSKVFEQDILISAGGRVSIEAENTDASAWVGNLVLLGVKLRELPK